MCSSDLARISTGTTAKISQSAGGIGLSIHNIRSTGSYISGTNGTSNGIVEINPDDEYVVDGKHKALVLR